MDAVTHAGISNNRVPGSYQGPKASCPSEHDILEQIIRARVHQTTSNLVQDFDSPSVMQSWYALFERIFLLDNSNHGPNAGPRDDLLFFVNKKLSVDATSVLQVHRKNSPKLPTVDTPLIDWEETIYLNLLMQFFVYVVTVAVCTRTGPQELQILHKFSETVYASPSRRHMDSKADSGEFAYPDLFFHVENYEEVFSNCVLRDCECLCVELTAYDLSGRLQGVCFLGAIQYASLKKLYESKVLSSHFSSNLGFLDRLSGNMPNSQIINSAEPTTAKFLRLLGPHARGLVEFAIFSDEFEECRGLQSGPHLSSLHCSCCGHFSSDTHSRGYVKSDKMVDFFSGDDVPLPESRTFRRVRSFDRNIFSHWSVSSFRQHDEFLPFINCGQLTSLQLPRSVKSARASADTSPVKVCSRILRPVYPSASADGRMRICGAHYGRTSSYRASRVFNLLTRITQCGVSSHTIPAEANPGVPGGHTELALNSANLDGDPWTIPGENSSLEQCGRTQGSFAQSWSWFKERRLLTSPRLSTGLTFISLPCHSILTALLETKQEPILNIAY